MDGYSRVESGVGGVTSRYGKTRADVWNGGGIAIDEVELRSRSHDIVDVSTDDNFYVSILQILFLPCSDSDLTISRHNMLHRARDFHNYFQLPDSKHRAWQT